MCKVILHNIVISICLSHEEEGFDSGFGGGSSVIAVALQRLLLDAEWLFDSFIFTPFRGSSPRKCITQDKKQPAVGKESLTSLLGQTGVFSNHSHKASGNTGLFPRSVGISLTLWCYFRRPMETPVEESERMLTGCGPGFLRWGLCENDLCGRNWTKKENAFMIIATSNCKPGSELTLTGSWTN